jgi:hypothetical protein
MRGFTSGCALLCALVASAHAGPPAAFSKDKGVKWSAQGSADVTCDGKPDKLFVGHKRGEVLIGIVPGGRHKPILFQIPSTNTLGRDAFCGGDVRLSIGPLDCRSSDGPIEGCRRARECKGFDAYDGECDAFDFYWDGKRRRLTYWRL